MPSRPCPFKPPRAERPRVQEKTLARGYGGNWRKLRAAFLAAHPLCAECRRQGRLTPATVVDHITPHHGIDDPLYWDLDHNGQALCASCHGAKSASERGSGPQVAPVDIREGRGG